MGEAQKLISEVQSFCQFDPIKRDMHCRLFSATFQFKGVNFDQERRSIMKKAQLKLKIQRIEKLISKNGESH